VSVDPLERTEARIGRLLTTGTRVSTTLLTVGLVASFLMPGSSVARSLLALGLVALMATPLARVAAPVVGFLGQRDWWFVLVIGFSGIEQEQEHEKEQESRMRGRGGSDAFGGRNGHGRFHPGGEKGSEEEHAGAPELRVRKPFVKNPARKRERA